MELLFNELSIDGQFHDFAAFKSAIGQVMIIRSRMKQFGRDLYCHHDLASRIVTKEATIIQAAQRLDRNSRRVLLGWLRHQGPFWDEDRQHSGDDYLECLVNGEQIVTDTAVGEAAYSCFHGQDRGLVSVVPSAWQISPISIRWHRGTGQRSVEIRNYWEAGTLEADLRDIQPPPRSWQDVERRACRDCPDLVFTPHSFDRLAGHPFHVGVADRILILLNVLQEYKNCFDDYGKRTPHGDGLYQEHFTGSKAWFSDSSDSEKRKFRSELTFRNPSRPNAPLFCTWHGKVKTPPQYRIHFSWPIRASEPLYIVYIGPKLTKR